MNSACKVPHVFIWKETYNFGHSPAVEPESMSPYLKEQEGACNALRRRIGPKSLLFAKELGKHLRRSNTVPILKGLRDRWHLQRTFSTI